MFQDDNENQNIWDKFFSCKNNLQLKMYICKLFAIIKFILYVLAFILILKSI
jgi:hypothetical protein